MTMTDTDLMRQALDAIVASGLSATKTKQARVAAAAALRARLAEPVQQDSACAPPNDEFLYLMAWVRTAAEIGDAEGPLQERMSARLMRIAEDDPEPTLSTFADDGSIAAPAAAPTVQPVAVPDGYALVPVEPTPEMLAAVVTTMDEHFCGEDAERKYRDDWAAMLAAAPKGGA